MSMLLIIILKISQAQNKTFDYVINLFSCNMNRFVSKYRLFTQSNEKETKQNRLFSVARYMHTVDYYNPPDLSFFFWSSKKYSSQVTKVFFFFQFHHVT
jgi:hypothetical protein